MKLTKQALRVWIDVKYFLHEIASEKNKQVTTYIQTYIYSFFNLL